MLKLPSRFHDLDSDILFALADRYTDKSVYDCFDIKIRRSQVVSVTVRKACDSADSLGDSP